MNAREVDGSSCSTSRRLEFERRPAARPARLPGAQGGHTGSLDPLASGLLPICLGQATKASGLLLDADKTYLFRIA
jgi:tRNA pseudouridine55 synthase